MGIQVFVTVAAMIIYAIALTADQVLANGDVMPNSMELMYQIEKISQWAMDSSSLILLISAVLCLAPFLPIWRKTQTGLLNYEVKKPVLLLLISVLIFPGFNMFLGLLFDIADITRFFPSYETILRALSGGSVIIRFLAIVVAGPIIEELCFRGIILNRLLTWTRTWVAVLIQALLFGIIHMNPFQSLYATLFGVALGYLYLRFRKLRFCIAGHMAFNLTAFVIMIIEESGMIVPDWTLIPGITVFAAGVYFT